MTSVAGKIDYLKDQRVQLLVGDLGNLKKLKELFEDTYELAESINLEGLMSKQKSEIKKLGIIKDKLIVVQNASNQLEKDFKALEEEF